MNALYHLAPPSKAEQQLLSLFALVDGLTLSDDVLQTISPLSTEETTEALSTLITKGWIQSDKTEPSYAMHPVIGTVIRKEQYSTLYKNATHFIYKIKEVIATQERDDATTLFVTYAQRLLEYFRHKTTFSLLALLKQVAHYHQQKGRHAIALGYYNRYYDTYYTLLESFYFRDIDTDEEKKRLHQMSSHLAQAYSAHIAKQNFAKHCKNKHNTLNQNQEKYMLKSYKQLASIYIWIEAYQKVLYCYLQMKRCYENHVRSVPEDLEQRDELARLYGDIALYYHKIGKDQKALAYYDKEIACDKMLCEAAPEEPLYQERLTFAYKRVAQQCEVMGEIEHAIYYHEKEAETMQVWCDMASFGDKIKIFIPKIYQEIGVLYEKLERGEEALEAYERAIQQNEAFFASSENVYFKDDLAESYEAAAAAYQRWGEREKALELNAKRVKLLKETSNY